MLNRTNQTTSATQNRLVLGTRQVALAATTNMGSQSLRTRHAHPQAVVEIPRAGIRPGFAYPSPMGPAMPWTPGLSSLPSWASTACLSRPVAQVFEERTSVVDKDDRSRRSGVKARARRVGNALRVS